MPAYRSPAEAEARDAVVERLRALRPGARIMHEVNASSFGNRIDVLAVDEAEIIAVEVKSAKDKLDRLPDQVTAMKGCAHTVIAALHEKFLVERRASQWNHHFERGGEYFSYSRPDIVPWGCKTWFFPETERGEHYCGVGLWHEPDQAVCKPLPITALDMLWAEELRQMCRWFGLPTNSRATMQHSIASLRWNLTGRQITRGICAALRARKCVEADPPINHTPEGQA